jgi:succinate dehydrogenase / fumarate reductase, cytochrome b subunit
MASRERPLSPHLQVYKWQVQMVTSILHRATGVVLVVGLLAMVWGLMALAGGPDRWEAFAACVGSLPGQVALFAFSWALAYHLLNGVRHLVQDAGHGYAILEFVRSSWISIIGSVVLVVVVWGIVLARWGQA